MTMLGQRAPARAAAPHVARPGRAPLRVAALALPKPPVDEGPGTGRRHYPSGAAAFDLRRRGEGERHDYMSSEECYALFPLVTRASTPLRIDDSEPAGLSALRVGDAGPATGRRQRPAAADAPSGASRPLLPYPAAHVDLRRELLARHSPELLLARHSPELLLAAQQQLRSQRRPEA